MKDVHASAYEMAKEAAIIFRKPVSFLEVVVESRGVDEDDGTSSINGKLIRELDLGHTGFQIHSNP